jgi:hypothetical protein
MMGMKGRRTAEPRLCLDAGWPSVCRQKQEEKGSTGYASSYTATEPSIVVRSSAYVLARMVETAAGTGTCGNAGAAEDGNEGEENG